ncbi:MAG: hypothetical protein HYS18_15845 [Burkholderiales bacterium]|nr:hypothetical protein [Burkholderiales bacterium]
MEEQHLERRRMSHIGLIDALIHTIGQLAISKDMQTRAIAGKALVDLRKLRDCIPTRRGLDRTVRKT